MNYEGKSVFDLGGGGVVDPQVEKNKNSIEQINQTFFAGAFPLFDETSSGTTLVSDNLSRFYVQGYVPQSQDFLLYEYNSSQFEPLTDLGNVYGTAWNRPSVMQSDRVVFDITIRATFLARSDAPIIIGLNITRKNGTTVLGEKQYKVRVFPPSSTICRYNLNIVEEVILDGADRLEMYTWGGLAVPMQLPVTFVSSSDEENQIKIIRLK